MAVQTHLSFLEECPIAYRGLELLATAVVLLSERRRIRYANPAAENLFELSKRQLVGHSAGSVFGEAPALFQAIDKALASGASYTEQELELGVNGKPRLHLSCTVSVIESRNATLLLEFRHIDQQLKIAREERLLERELDRPPLIEYTQLIIGEADRLQTLVNRLLTPHRLPSYRRTNIHELLARVASVVQAEFPEVAIASDFDISLPEFEADPEQLTQALLNVVKNAAQALQAVPRPREIQITTRVARSVTLARRRYRLALAVSVEDNGPGIPDVLRDRIFYPLVSGREGGSGLGLTIAQTFIAQHNGAIECVSMPGRTVFTILLPLEFKRPGA